MLLNSAGSLPLALNSFGTDSLAYSSGAGNALAGQALKIVLSSTGTAGVFSEAFFDNIALDARTEASTVPEPGALGLVALGLLAMALKGRRTRGDATRQR